MGNLIPTISAPNHPAQCSPATSFAGTESTLISTRYPCGQTHVQIPPTGSCVPPAIAPHLERRTAGFHGTPAAALVLAGIGEQPAARTRIGTAARLRYQWIADQIQRIECDTLERQ